MNETVVNILYFVNSVLALYGIVIFIRILLTWFGNVNFGRFYLYLCKITDPYLNLFRRFKFLCVNNFDLSPVAALAVLSIAGSIINRIAETGRLTIGFLLALLVGAIWSVAAFLIGFFIVIIVVRLIGYLVSANIYSRFWQIIDYISRPVIFTITKIFFKNRYVRLFTGLVVSIISLIALYAVFSFIFHKLIIPALLNMPI